MEPGPPYFLKEPKKSLLATYKLFSTIGTGVSCFKRALLYTNSATGDTLGLTLLWMVENIFYVTLIFRPKMYPDCWLKVI